MDNRKIHVTITFYQNEEHKLDSMLRLFKDPQEKTFNDIDSCMMWCRKNYKKIHAINDYRTMGAPISHYMVMDAIRGVGR